MDSSVTSFGTVSAPFAALHRVVASVCCMIGTQLTVAQVPSATIMEVLAGKERATPTRLRLSPPLVRYVYTPGAGNLVRSEEIILSVCSRRYMRNASRNPTGDDTVRKTNAHAVPLAALTITTQTLPRAGLANRAMVGPGQGALSGVSRRQGTGGQGPGVGARGGSGRVGHP